MRVTRECIQRDKEDSAPVGARGKERKEVVKTGESHLTEGGISARGSDL